MKVDMIAGWCDLAAKYHIPEREMRNMQPAFSACDQDV